MAGNKSKNNPENRTGSHSKNFCEFCNSERNHVKYVPAIGKPKNALICTCGIYAKNGVMISETVTA